MAELNKEIEEKFREEIHAETQRRREDFKQQLCDLRASARFFLEIM